MSSETEVTENLNSPSVSQPAAKVRPKKNESILDGALKLLSSVRLGVTLLSILLVCSIIGMLIMQVNVEGFQAYYERLSPSQRLIYGKLGFFDIYRSWYFNLLLAVTGLNIILASIDRFPTAWQYIANPKLKASPNFIRAQMFSSEAEMSGPPQKVSEAVRAAWRKHGFKARVSEDNNRLTVFAQRNSWNRLGAYAVHVALLTIFVGGFLTSRYGVGGMMEIRPGRASSTFSTLEVTVDEGQKIGQAMLPFKVECTDLQQKLIRPEGNLEATNTIDWLSYVKIKDGDKEIPALVHLNEPFDYRGYRFFQSQFTPVGNARQITVLFEPVAGGQSKTVTIARDGEVDVEGIGRVAYAGFFPDFQMDSDGPTTLTGDYNNPVAQLTVKPLDGSKPRLAFAFNPQLADQYLANTEQKGEQNPLLVAGHRVLLKNFEKVALAHTLAVQYDPGRIPVYIGFALLVAALLSVFLFSHQRMWAVIEQPDGKNSKIYFGGNTNRNRPAFEGRFNSLVQSVTGERGAENE